MTKTIQQRLLSVQLNIEAVTKSASNPHFKSRYADLNEVLAVSKSALNREGLFIVQTPGIDSFGKYLETAIIDAETKESLAGKVYFSGNESNMQQIGAAMTYARRFGLVSLLALESEDDDGETAVGRGSGVAVAKSAAVPSSRKDILSKISSYETVAIKARKMTADDMARKLVDTYNVRTKEDLSDAQASELLKSLTKLVEGK